MSLSPTAQMDGWVIRDFTSFSTVLQSYQDDGTSIIKGCVQWNCCPPGLGLSPCTPQSLTETAIPETDEKEDDVQIYRTDATD